MDFRQLTYFLAVAEELSFSRAADRIHISQPPLSRQVMDLEEELGTRLFERTAKGVRLTEAGSFLKIEAKRILGLEERTRSRIRDMASGGERTLRIGFVGSAMYSFLPDFIAALKKELPGLKLELEELSSESQARALTSGKIDLGILRSWIQEPGIAFEPIAEETLSMVFPVGEETADPPKRLSDLAGEPFIGFSRSCAPGVSELAQRICERAGFIPRTIFIANEYASVLRLVSAGLGWSIVPSMTLGSKGPGLGSVELDDLAERLVMGTAIRSDENDELVSVARIVMGELMARKQVVAGGLSVRRPSSGEQGEDA